MFNMEESFKEYLKKIKNVEEDKCWFCGKTPEQIRREFFKFKTDPEKEELYENLTLDDIVIMTYKTKKPICAACYFNIKKNPKLIEEIFERPEEDVW